MRVSAGRGKGKASVGLPRTCTLLVLLIPKSRHLASYTILNASSVACNASVSDCCLGVFDLAGRFARGKYTVLPRRSTDSLSDGLPKSEWVIIAHSTRN
jgi:hypothetical protein